MGAKELFNSREKPKLQQLADATESNLDDSELDYWTDYSPLFRAIDKIYDFECQNVPRP